MGFVARESSDLRYSIHVDEGIRYNIALGERDITPCLLPVMTIHVYEYYYS